MAKQKMSTKRNRDNQTEKQKSHIFSNSAIIQEGRDTGILQEDLFREFQPDKANTDQSFLINGEWVRFFDPNSSFLKELMALVNNSTTLRNILNKKTTLTLGDGFMPIEATEVPFLQTLRKAFVKMFMSDSGIKDMNTLIGCVNLNNETLEEVIEKVAFDWWAFGNAMVELAKGKKNGKEIVFIYHIPLHKAAIKKVDDSNIIKTIGISDDWALENGGQTTVTELPLYPEFNSKKRSAIHIKNYSPGFFYWGLPGNVASRMWAMIEYLIPKYNIAKFDNGFVLSAIVQAYGNMTPDEAKGLVKKFTDTFSGTGQNSKVLFQVLRDEKYKTEVTTLEDKSEGRWLELSDLATKNIITGNEWEPSLSGIVTAGQLGNNQQIRDALELVKNTGIKQFQRKLMDKIVNPFVQENAKLNVVPADMFLKIANLNPISLASMLKPDMILTRDEQRDILGFEPLAEEDESPEELEGQQPQSE